MVNIQLQDSVAAALSAHANEQGLSLEAFLAQIAATTARPKQPINLDEWERELDELSFDAPPLPADFSRADIYLDHD
jgi:hypothetical protein